MTIADLNNLVDRARERMESDIAAQRAEFEAFVRGLHRWLAPINAENGQHANGNGAAVGDDANGTAPNVAAVVRQLVETVAPSSEFTLDDLIAVAERRGCIGRRTAFATAMKREVNAGRAVRVREGGPHSPAVYTRARA